MTSHTPPSPGWIVRLQGDQIDLDICERFLDQRFDPRIERVPHEKELIRALRSATLDPMNDATAVTERATTLVAWLNGALGMVGGTELLAIRDVGRIDNDGSIGFFNFASAKIAGRGNMLAGIAVVGNPNVATASVPPRPSVVQRLIDAAEKDDDVASALKHFGQPTNWYELWTAYEIIEDDLFLSIPRAARPPSPKGI